MQKKALIVWGGWGGHEPEQVAQVLARELKDRQFAVEVSNTLDSFLDAAKLKELALIVPCWTMGKITAPQRQAVCAAVEAGTGLAGVHGGLCDAFREDTAWQFLTGGQFVDHPGGGKTAYTVKITAKHWITQGLSDFQLTSEQYYMHVDPANKVLATTRFPVASGPYAANGDVEMPVAWTRLWGRGRVFYCSVGHDAATVELPSALRLITRGLLWAAQAEGTA